MPNLLIGAPLFFLSTQPFFYFFFFGMPLLTITRYGQKIYILIIIAILSKLVITCCSELSNAETYYWNWSLYTQLNYYDQPPMVAWLINVSTLHHVLQKEVFVRWGAVLSSAVKTWIFFKVGVAINCAHKGWLTSILYTASLYASIVAGAYILLPPMMFLMLSLLILIKIIQSPPVSRQLLSLWRCFGFRAGYCLMSKLSGIFLWTGRWTV